MQTTMAELYESGERFAAIAVHFPVAGHVEAEGRIRRVPSSTASGCNYWVGPLCLAGTAILKSSGEERSTWNVYFYGEEE
tara:strand:- start:1358 stop:1597 length:240 start_codon:yes stop_codon:yes gene_type:complete